MIYPVYISHISHNCNIALRFFFLLRFDLYMRVIELYFRQSLRFELSVLRSNKTHTVCDVVLRMCVCVCVLPAGQRVGLRRAELTASEWFDLCVW